VKPLRAADVHAGHILEWLDKRCTVLRVRPAERAERPRQYGNPKAGVILSVEEIASPHERHQLHYFYDEEVTILGQSFG
jgi:hypothetical protein